MVATLYQYIPVRVPAIREEPDSPDSIHRSTEARALQHIAMRARCRQQGGGRAQLSGLHLELLRLERGAMQFLPQLTYDERMDFIAAASRLWNVTSRQIEAMLDQASSIIMLRELSGMGTAIDDLAEYEIKRLYQNAVRYHSKRIRNVDRQRAASRLAAVGM